MDFRLKREYNPLGYMVKYSIIKQKILTAMGDKEWRINKT